MSAMVYEYLNKVMGHCIADYEYEWLFVRCPKAGTNTVHDALKRAHGGPFLHTAQRAYPVNWTDWITGLTVDKWDSIRKFSVVRHPYDRFNSFYKNFYEGDPSRTYNPNRGKPIEEVIAGLPNEPANNWWTWSHKLPCTYFTHHEGVQMVDRVFQLEELGEDLASWLGIRANFGVHNAIPGKGLADRDLSRESVEILDEYYSEDFKEFGYERGL